MSIVTELKRRNVFKVGAAYVVAAWLLLQLLSILLPAFAAPAWVLRVFVLLLGVGFVVAMFIAWAFELTPEGIKPTTAVNPAESITPATGQQLNKLIITGLVLILVVVVLNAYVLEDETGEVETGAVATGAVEEINVTSMEVPAESTAATLSVSAAQTIPDLSIAVLPFTNLSSDQEQEYFSDGLAEELLNKLAQVDGLQVAARTSSFYFKGRNEDMRTIGETLGVKHILEGSVRKGGTQLRITARLINAADGYELWVGNFDRDLADIFAVQDEIATEVSRNLSVTLGAGEFDRPGMTRNVAAYDLYLQGTAQWRVNGVTPEALNSAIAYLRQAVALDSTFGSAWLALRGAYLNAVVNLPTEQTRDYQSLGQDALLQARAVAPDMPGLLIADAGTQRNAGNWAEAEAIFQQLLQENGAQSADINAAYGSLLATVGRSSDALPYLIRAVRLDPLSTAPTISLTRTLLDLGRVDEARAEADRAMALGNAGNNVFLGALKMLAAYTVDDYALAAQLVRAGGAPPGQGFIDVADLLAAGDKAGALAKMHEMMAQDVSPVTAAALLVPAILAGDPQFGMDIVKDRYALNPQRTVDQLGMWLDVAAPMRRLPMYKDWVQDAGLVDYWRSINNWGDHCRPINDDFECF